MLILPSSFIYLQKKYTGLLKVLISCLEVQVHLYLSGFGIKDPGATQFAGDNLLLFPQQADSLDTKSEQLPAGLTQVIRKRTQEPAVPRTQAGRGN